jgi:HK97 family phage major capsid protein
MQVRSTTAQTENTAIVGAFRTAAQLFRRSGPTVTVSTEHASFFVENKVAILAEQREALAVYAPAAFCTVTGI